MKRAVRAIFPIIRRMIRNQHKGSLTVEAALVLPLCISAAVFLCGIFRAVSSYEQVDSALCQAVRQLEAASIKDEDTGTARAYAYFLESCAESSSKLSAVSGGAYGVVISCSMDGKTGAVTLDAVFKLNFPGILLPDRGITVSDRVTGRKWRGADGLTDPGSSGTAETEEKITVYITENQSVYHVNRDCTHLKLTVAKVPAGTADAAVNIYGAHYRPCDKCSNGSAMNPYVYIAAEGDCWHNSGSCSGLKRSITEISLEEAEEIGLSPCLRCGGGP